LRLSQDLGAVNGRRKSFAYRGDVEKKDNSEGMEAGRSMDEGVFLECLGAGGKT